MRNVFLFPYLSTLWAAVTASLSYIFLRQLISDRSIRKLLVVAVVLLLPGFAYSQSQSDTDAIYDLLNKYRASEDAGDHSAQGALMTPDRVWVSATTRRVDNVLNMKIQQAQADRRKKAIPGLQQFSEDRDFLIKYLAGGQVAVVTFFRQQTRVFPVGTPAELTQEYAPGKEWILLVLEKQNGKWIIVATHV